MRHVRIGGFLLAVALAIVPRIAPAQSPAASPGTDPRWLPWLGCWTADSAGPGGGVTCVVPVAGASDVDMLTVGRGAVRSRERLDASGRPRPVDTGGCRGSQAVRWSPTGARAYLRSTYACGGEGGSGGAARGETAAILAFSTGGDWLRVTEVRAGGGAIVSIERLREVAPPAGLSPAAARAIERQRLAITTARAAASAPIAIDDVAESLRRVDSTLVRAWVLATDQRFAVDADQAARLARANLPTSVVQAILGSTPRDRDGGVAGSTQAATVFAEQPAYAGPGYPSYPPAGGYVCQAGTCYAAPPGGVVYEVNVAPSYVPYPYVAGYVPIVVHRGEPREYRDGRGAGRGEPRGGGPGGTQGGMVGVHVRPANPYAPRSPSNPLTPAPAPPRGPGGKRP